MFIYICNTKHNLGGNHPYAWLRICITPSLLMISVLLIFLLISSLFKSFQLLLIAELFFRSKVVGEVEAVLAAKDCKGELQLKRREHDLQVVFQARLEQFNESKTLWKIVLLISSEYCSPGRLSSPA